MFGLFKKKNTNKNEAFLFRGDIFDIVNYPKYNYNDVTFLLGISKNKLRVGDKIHIDSGDYTIKFIEDVKHDSVSSIKANTICALSFEEPIPQTTRDSFKLLKTAPMLTFNDSSNNPAVDFYKQDEKLPNNCMRVKTQKDIAVGDKLIIFNELFGIVEIMDDEKKVVEKISQDKMCTILLDREVNDIVLDAELKLSAKSKDSITFNFSTKH